MEEIKLSLSLRDLKFLLNQQKEMTSEAIYAELRNVSGIESSAVRNAGKGAKFPSEIQTLDKYLS